MGTKMELTLERQTFTNMSTIGTLKADTYNEHGPVCYILEDKDRQLESNPKAKIYGKTAIPRGRYRIVVTMSNRFKRELPLLLKVPGYEGVRIHPGNTAENTEGCLLPGVAAGQNIVHQSRVAFDQVNTLIHRALNRGEEVWITIK